VLLFHLLGIHGLWYAPIYGWLILVSGWARRAALLWATVPLLAIGVVERIAFSTSHFANMLAYRFSGGGEPTGSRARSIEAMLMPNMSLGQFVVSPGLWTGFALAALFLALAMRVRRSRGPI
jgi:ABC-2 type transport system permease protein